MRTPKELAQILRSLARLRGLPTPGSRHRLPSFEKCSRFSAYTHSLPREGLPGRQKVDCVGISLLVRLLFLNFKQTSALTIHFDLALFLRFCLIPCDIPMKLAVSGPLHDGLRPL